MNASLPSRSRPFAAKTFAAWFLLLSAIGWMPLAALGGEIAVKVPQREQPVDYRTEIAPLLSKNCLACHSESQADGDLVLESLIAMQKGGSRGPALVPGKAEQSLLFRAAAHQVEPEMPPADNKVGAQPLTPEQLGLLKLWIDQGAKSGMPANPPNASASSRHALPPDLHPVFAVAVTPDGRFAACNRADRVFIYDLQTGQTVASWREGSSSSQHGSAAVSASSAGLVRSLAFSPDGSRLAVGGFRSVSLWEGGTPGEQQRFTLPLSATCMAIAPNGKFAAFGAADDDNANHGVVVLCDLGTGAPTHRLQQPGAVTGVQFIAQGSALVTLHATGQIAFWNVADGKSLGQLKLPSIPTAVCLLAGGQTLILGSEDGHLRSWNVAALQTAAQAGAGQPADAPAPLRDWAAHDTAVTHLAPSAQPNQASVCISASVQGPLRMWSVAEGTEVRSIAHQGALAAAVASGERLATLADGKIKLLEVSSDRTVATPTGNIAQAEQIARAQAVSELARVQAAYLKQDTGTAAEASKRRTEELAKALETQTKAQEALVKADEAAKKPREELQAAREAAEQAQASLTKAQAAVAATDAPTDEAKAALRQADADHQAAQKKLRDTESRTSNAISAADKAAEALDVATAQHQRLQEQAAAAASLVQQREQATAAAEAAAKERADALKALEAAKDKNLPDPVCLALSADARILAIGFADGSIQLVNAEDGSPLRSLAGHKAAVRHLAFTVDNQLLSVDHDRTVVRWRTQANWSLARTIGDGQNPELLSGRVLGLAFHPDGQRLATAGGLPSRGGELKLWNAASGELLHTFEPPHRDTVHAVAFSPDGQQLASASADQLVRLWNTEEGALLRTLEGHTGYALGAAFSADGAQLATCGVDQVVKLWDAATGEQIRTYSGNAYRIGPFRQPVTSVCFVGDSEHMVCSCGDGTVRLLRVGTDRDLKVFPGANTYVQAVAASPDGTAIVAGGADGVLRVWNLYTGREVRSFEPAP